MEEAEKKNPTENTPDLAALMEAAEEGDEEAGETLGNYYFEKKDYEEAVKWYQRSDWYSDGSENRLQIARCYELLGNYEEAFGWWSDASLYDSSGEPDYHIALCYLNGKGVKKDTKEGIRYLFDAVDEFYAPAVFDLAERYFTGDGVDQDPREALKLLLGCCIIDGEVFGEKYREAEERLSRMKEEELQLGKRYLHGDGVERDLKKAIEHLSRAEEWELNPVGQEDLISLISETEYQKEQEDLQTAYSRLEDADITEILAEADKWRKENPRLAAKLYVMAAEKGSDIAVEKAAEAYAAGRDTTEALKWYQKAYENGSGSAALQLGRYCLDLASRRKQPVPWDQISAYYQFAAEKGIPEGMHALGAYYHDRVHDEEKALYWLKKGNELSPNQNSERIIRTIEKKAEESAKKKEEKKEAVKEEKKAEETVYRSSYVDRDITLELLGILAVVLLYLVCPFFLKIGAGSSEVEEVIKLPFLIEPIVTFVCIAAIVALNAFTWFSLGSSFSDSLSVAGGLAGLVGGFVIVFTMKDAGTLPKVQWISRIIGIVFLLRILMKKLKR